MMKLLFSFLLMLMSSLVFADQGLEKAVNELEARSAALAIDANSYRNTIAEKSQSLHKQKNGMVSTDSSLKLHEMLGSSANQLLSTAQALYEEGIQIMQSGRTELEFYSYRPEEPSLAGRIFVVLREIECTKFSIELVRSAQTAPTFTEALSLANTVASGCAKINKAELSSHRLSDTPEKKPTRKRKE